MGLPCSTTIHKKDTLNLTWVKTMEISIWCARKWVPCMSNSYNYCMLIILKRQVVCLKMYMCCFILLYNPQLNVYHFSIIIRLQCYQYLINVYIYVVTLECKCSYSFIQFFMKHLYVLMSWPEDMDMLWIKFLRFNSFFLFCKLNLFHDSSYISTCTFKQMLSSFIYKMKDWKK